MDRRLLAVSLSLSIFLLAPGCQHTTHSSLSEANPYADFVGKTYPLSHNCVLIQTHLLGYEIWDDLLQNYGRYNAGKLPKGTAVQIESFSRAQRQLQDHSSPATRDYAVVRLPHPSDSKRQLHIEVPLSTLKHILKPQLDSLPDMSTQ
jgi:hypothetical protein